MKTTRVCKHPPVVRLFANTRHVFANKFDISVTGHMQTTSVCKFRHLVTSCVCKHPPVVCKQPDHQAGVCKQPDHQAGVCKQPYSHRRVFANNRTVTVGCLQTTGQSPAVGCKQPGSLRRWFANNRTVSGGGLQTPVGHWRWFANNRTATGGGLQTTAGCLRTDADRDWWFRDATWNVIAFGSFVCKPPHLRSGCLQTTGGCLQTPVSFQIIGNRDKRQHRTAVGLTTDEFCSF